MRRTARIVAATACGLAVMLASVVRAEEVVEAGLEAFAAFQQEDFVGARERAERQWQLAEARDDGLQAGLAAANQAAVLALAGRVDEALEWYATAESRLRPIGRKRELGRIAVARGLALYMKRATDLGDAELARARELLGAQDWPLQFVTTLLEVWTGLDMWKGREALENLLARARESGDPSRVTAGLLALGWVYGSMGENEMALASYEAAIGLFEKRGDVASVALARCNMGVAHLRAHEPGRAAEQLREAVGLAREVNEPRLEFRALNDLSIALAHMGDAVAAREADLQAEAVLAAIAEELRHGRLLDTPLVDYYDLLRERYLNPPRFRVDGFPWLFDQLALAPDRRDESDEGR